MSHWLVKSEPDAFSWEQQVAHGIETRLNFGQIERAMVGVEVSQDRAGVGGYAIMTGQLGRQ